MISAKEASMLALQNSEKFKNLTSNFQRSLDECIRYGNMKFKFHIPCSSPIDSIETKTFIESLRRLGYKDVVVNNYCIEVSF